jgi:hypothetical protein
MNSPSPEPDKTQPDQPVAPAAWRELVARFG